MTTESPMLPIIYFGDRFVPESEARVPVTTHALHYGTAVFEGIRAYGDGQRSHLFRPHAHYERLLRNADLLRMSPGVSVGDLVEMTVELLKRNEAFADVYIRPLIFKNKAGIGAGLPPGETLAIMAQPLSRWDVPRTAASADFSRWRRFSSDACPAGAKISGLYVNSSLARAEAQAAGVDQPILLTARGDVAEGYGGNIFAATGGRMITPPPEADILAGITRGILIEHFQSRNDLRFIEEPLAPSVLLDADEAFFCGTGIEILPIGHIGETILGDGSCGPITAAAAKWYREVVTGRAGMPTDWRVPVAPGR